MADETQDFDTVSLDQLETISLSLDQIFAVANVNGKLFKSKLSDLIAFIAPLIPGVTASNFVSVPGTVLPNNTASPSQFTFVGSGTFTQTTGGSITTTALLNLLAWNGTTWSLVKAIDTSAFLAKSDYNFGGAFATVAAANTAIPNTIVNGKNQRDGKRVDIGTSGNYVTYWWKGGTADANLVIMNDFAPYQTKANDNYQGAFPDLASANSAIPNTVNATTTKNNREGKIVLIGTANNYVVYTWKNGYLDTNLVEYFSELATKSSLAPFIPVTSGTNLVNPNDPDYKVNFILNGLGSDMGKLIPNGTSGTFKVSNKIYVKPNTVYTPSYKRYVAFYRADDSCISVLLDSRTDLFFTYPAGTSYFRFDGADAVLKAVEGQFTTFPANVPDFYFNIELKNGTAVKAKYITDDLLSSILASALVQTKAITDPINAAVGALENEVDIITNDKYPLLVDLGLGTRVGGYMATPKEIAATRIDDYSFSIPVSEVTPFDSNIKAFLGVFKVGEEYKLYTISSYSKTTGVLTTLLPLPATLTTFSVGFSDGLHFSRYGFKAVAEYIANAIERFAYRKTPVYSFIAPLCKPGEIQGVDNNTLAVVAPFIKTAQSEQNIFIIPNDLIATCTMGPNDGSAQYGRIFFRAYHIVQRNQGAGVKMKISVSVNGFCRIILGENIKYNLGALTVSVADQNGAFLYNSTLRGANQEILVNLTKATTELNFTFVLAEAKISFWQISSIEVFKSAKINETPIFQKPNINIAYLMDSYGEFPQFTTQEAIIGLKRADGSSAAGLQYISEHMREYLATKGYTVQTFNNSKGGQTSAWGRYWLKRLVLDLPVKPDYCVFDFYGNDAFSRPFAINNTDSSYDFDPNDPWTNKVKSAGGIRGSVTLDEWISNMKYISDTLIANGIKPVILIDPIFSGPNVEVFNENLRLLTTDLRKI